MPSEKNSLALEIDSKKSILTRLSHYLLESIAVIFWVYIILKLFIVDVDIMIIQKFFPELKWVLDFRFLFFVSVLAFCLFVFERRKITIWIFFVLFYPFVIFFRVPIYIFKTKSWTLAFAFLNSLISIFMNFRRNVIIFAIFSVSVVVLFVSDSDHILYVFSVILGLLTLFVYYKQFISSFQPSAVFRTYKKIFTRIRKKSASTFELDEEIRDLPTVNFTKPQIEKWNNTLKMAVLFNRSCHFVGAKLRDYQISEWRIIPSIFSVAYLLSFSTINFSFIYYSIFKIDNGSFSYTGRPMLFEFFYFSFNNLIFSSIDDLNPVSILARVAYMAQIVLIISVVVIMVSLVISYRAERYSRDLDEIILEVKKEEEYMEDHIRDQFGLDGIQDAINHLEKFKSDLLKVIYAMSSDIDARS